MVVIASTAGANDHPHPGILLEDLDELGFCLPEGPLFHVLDAEGVLHTCHLSAPYAEHARQRLNTEAEIQAWPDADAPRACLLAAVGGAVIYRPTNDGEPSHDQATRHWSDALALEGRWRRSLLYPEGGTAEWLRLVRGRFQAQVLRLVTAWMCLESEAQRNALLKKQEEVLSGNASLDVGNDDLTHMREPPLWWLLLGLLP